MKNSRVQACKDLKENITGFLPYVPGTVLRLYNDKQENITLALIEVTVSWEIETGQQYYSSSAVRGETQRAMGEPSRSI